MSIHCGLRRNPAEPVVDVPAPQIICPLGPPFEPNAIDHGHHGQPHLTLPCNPVDEPPRPPIFGRIAIDPHNMLIARGPIAVQRLGGRQLQGDANDPNTLGHLRRNSFQSTSEVPDPAALSLFPRDRAMSVIPSDADIRTSFMRRSAMGRQTSEPRRRTIGAMSMRTLIVGAFAASVVMLTGPLALAEEPATHHHTAYNHHDNRHPHSRFRHHHHGPSPELRTHHNPPMHPMHPSSRFRHHHHGPPPSNVGR
jgi:hypothetical protein